MLERFKVYGFRCLYQVDVPLRPLTVLVGPNDSGKSAFLTALQYMSLHTHIALTDVWRQDPEQRVWMMIQPPVGTIEYGSPGRDAPRVDYGTRLVGKYHLPSPGVAVTGQGHADGGGVPQLGEFGENVPTLLDYLLRRDRQRFFSFVNVMRSLVPGLEDIDIATPEAHMRSVAVVVEKGLRIPGERLSAGVRLLLFFVALAHHPTPPELILLEEPESGVHPRRLADVLKLLRQVTRGAHGGRPAQVVLTTHSPYLLDLVDPSEDCVLVFRREEDGKRTVEPVDAERLKTFLDEFMLGEIWFNEGEAGLVKRSPC
jgi:predicted ATPase